MPPTSGWTVTRWVNAYCDAGLDGLRPKTAPGTPGTISPVLAEEVRRWVIEGPAKQGLDRANWTHAEVADHLLTTQGIRPPGVWSSGSGQGSTSACTARPTVTTGQPRAAGPGQGVSGCPGKRTSAGELVRLTQDEARFPMVPTLAATLGAKGHRPTVGTRDNKALLYVLAVINLVTAAVHANPLDDPKNATKKTGRSKTRRMPEAFAAHLRHIARV